MPPNVEPNGLDAVGAAEPKVLDPKAGVLVPPNREGELNGVEVVVDEAPKREAVPAAELEPKGVEEPNGEEAELKREVVDPNPVDPKVDVPVLGANGFEEVVAEKGLAAAACPNAPVAPNGLGCARAVCPNALLPPTGFAPPDTFCTQINI